MFTFPFPDNRKVKVSTSLSEILLVSAVCNTPDNDYCEYYLDNPSHSK